MTDPLSSNTAVAEAALVKQIAKMSRNPKPAPQMESLGSRIARARGARFSQTALARELGITRSSVSQWESGDTEPTPEKLRAIALLTHVDFDWLATGRGVPDLGTHTVAEASNISHISDISQKRDSNARLGGAVSFGQRIPVYGQAMGGRHGEFVLNGNKVADILAPASLEGVHNAYAVYIAGSSMENRYFAGEVAFVHPGLPVRRGDFVVAQIATEEGSAPLAFVKRFISLDDRKLKLEQLNPKKLLEFPRKLVVSVHLILMAGRP